MVCALPTNFVYRVWYVAGLVPFEVVHISKSSDHCAGHHRDHRWARFNTCRSYDQLCVVGILSVIESAASAEFIFVVQFMQGCLACLEWALPGPCLMNSLPHRLQLVGWEPHGMTGTSSRQ